MNQERLLRWPEVKQRVGLCRSRVYQLIEQGTFPKQIKLSERAAAWKESDISKWIEDRIQASREGNNNV